MSLAIEGIKIATKALIDVSKQAIQSFVAQEQAEKQLETVIESTGQAAGVTADEMLGLAKSLSEVTKFSDEAIIGAENILLTFTQIGKEVIPGATETILNMSQALGTDLKGQAIQLGKALNDPIKGVSALQDVGVSLSEEQKNLINSFVEVGDVAGAQKVILKELATEFGNSASAARDTFGGSLAALKNTQNDLLGDFGKVISVVGKDYVEASIKSAQAIRDWMAEGDNMARVTTAISSAFTVVSKVISAVANNIKNFIFIIKDAVDAALSLTKVFQKDFDFDNVKEKFKDLSETYKNTGKQLVVDVKGIVKSVTEEYKGFEKNVAETNAKLKAQDPGLEDGIKTSGERALSEQESFLKKMQDNFANWQKAQAPTWQQWSGQIQGIVTNALSTVQMAFDTFYSNQQSALESSLEKQLMTIDADTQKRIESAGVAQETRTEQLNKEIEELQNKINMTRSLQQQEALQEQLIDKENEKKRIAILEDGNAKKDKAEKKAAAKEKALKEEQVRSNKAMAIANVWINAASAVMGFWAAFAPMGIPGLVLAAVASAASLTMAGVQTGIIASQGFEDGGVIGGNSLTGDRVNIRANSKERVLTPEQNKGFEELVFGGGGGAGGNIVIENMTVMANDPDSFRAAMVEETRFELAR